MDSAVVPRDRGYLQQSLIEISLGFVSGAVGKIIEYPFDTIKVRMQYSQSLTNPLFTGTADCILKTYSNEGVIHGFYKGVASPLFGASMEYASLFWTYDLSKLVISKSLGSEELQFKHKVVAGGASGLITSFVLTPIELIKCQMQVNNLNNGKRYNLLDTISRIYHQDRKISSFWKGQSSTLFRETGGTMFWFGTYEYLTLYFQKQNNRTQNSSLELLTSGAAAGITYNLSFYPFDTIKSVMQTSTTPQTYLQVIKRLYLNGGVRNFYTGCGITLVRALPSNAIVFYLYQTMKTHLT